DIPIIAAWIVMVPLWQRYSLTVERAAANFSAGMQRGEWLPVVDGDAASSGFAWVVPQGAFGRSPCLSQIGVRAEVADTGLGGRLRGAAERHAAQLADALFLLTSAFNHAAQPAYHRHRHVGVGAIADYVIPNATELIFRKRRR